MYVHGLYYKKISSHKRYVLFVITCGQGYTNQS